MEGRLALLRPGEREPKALLLEPSELCRVTKEGKLTLRILIEIGKLGIGIAGVPSVKKLLALPKDSSDLFLDTKEGRLVLLHEVSADLSLNKTEGMEGKPALRRWAERGKLALRFRAAFG